VYEYNAIVVSVYDGDTFRADVDLGFGTWLKNQPIRVHGIDTPELGTVEGKAARYEALLLLPVGSKVTLRTFKDAREKYGRYLGKVTLPDGSDYATALVEKGLAKPYFGDKKEPP
jgi:micrococcal nuclease